MALAERGVHQTEIGDALHELDRQEGVTSPW
jgi:hypothetical protein